MNISWGRCIDTLGGMAERLYAVATGENIAKIREFVKDRGDQVQEGQIIVRSYGGSQYEVVDPDAFYVRYHAYAIQGDPCIPEEEAEPRQAPRGMNLPEYRRRLALAVRNHANRLEEVSAKHRAEIDGLAVRLEKEIAVINERFFEEGQ